MAAMFYKIINQILSDFHNFCEKMIYEFFGKHFFYAWVRFEWYSKFLCNLQGIRKRTRERGKKFPSNSEILFKYFHTYITYVEDVLRLQFNYWLLWGIYNSDLNSVDVRNFYLLSNCKDFSMLKRLESRQVLRWKHDIKDTSKVMHIISMEKKFPGKN